VDIAQAIREARLYGILDLGYVAPERALETASRMLKGGVGILQLRAKKLTPVDILSLGREVSAVCRERGVPFILNDHPDLVKETGASGVHVGQDDMPVAEARRLAGSGAIVGKSTHSLAQAEAGWREGADYIGFGPLFATPTKPDYAEIGLLDIAEAHRRVPIPIFCIGGIKLENLPVVLAAGARRAVIVSGILQTADIPDYCGQAIALLKTADAVS